jgi:hypothetical protein
VRMERQRLEKEPCASFTGTLPKVSVASVDIVTAARDMFSGTVVAVIPPAVRVPAQWRDVLASWGPTSRHAGLRGYQSRQLLGWHQGAPVYAS